MRCLINRTLNANQMKPPHDEGIRMACCMACRPNPASQGQGRTHGVALCRGFSSCSWQRTSNPYSIPTTLLLSAQSAAMAKGHPPSLVKAAGCDQPHTRGMHAQQGTGGAHVGPRSGRSVAVTAMPLPLTFSPLGVGVGARRAPLLLVVVAAAAAPQAQRVRLVVPLTEAGGAFRLSTEACRTQCCDRYCARKHMLFHSLA